MKTPNTNQVQRRFLGDSKPSAVNVEARTVDFSFSSEQPVLRFDWQIGEYWEVLDHGPGFNLSRMQGGPLLWAHDTADQRGAIQRAYVGADKRGYATAKLSRSTQGEQLLQDMSDGIVRGISFAYAPTNWREEGTAPDGRPVLRAMSTEVLEISAVSVPADNTVGIGRSLSLEITTSRSQTMETETEVLSPEQQERARCAAITALCSAHGLESADYVRSGASIEQVRTAVLDHLARQSDRSRITTVPILDLPERERRNYSISRAILASAYPSEFRREAGLEIECSQAMAAKIGKRSKGLYIPIFDLSVSPLPRHEYQAAKMALDTGNTEAFARAMQQRASYAVGASGTGGATVATDVLQMIELLRNMPVVAQLGATYLPDLVGNVQIPRQNATATAYWVAEGQDVTRSEGGFDFVSMSPKTVGGISQYTRLMLLQSTVPIDMFIMQDLASIIGLAIDLAALSGTGSGNQPLGITNTSGIGSVAMGANGAAFTNFDPLIDLRTTVASKNALMGAPGYVMNSKTVGSLAKLKNSYNEYLWVGDSGGPADGIPPTIMNMPWNESNQLRSNLTKNTGTNLSEVIFGNWTSLLIGEWGILDLLSNPYANSVYPSGGVLVRALRTIDIAVRHPESFAVISDLVTS